MIAAVVERCAGIDVGKRFLKVCVMVGPLTEEPRFEIRRVDCTMSALEGLRQWLKAEGVSHAVMESTGPYWVPVFNILENECKVVLANPVEVKNRKGHKTDAQDSWWLAHLLRHGMIRASFIPPAPTRELRELRRRRKKLVEAASQERNRIQKQLEYGNVKLGNELSDVFGLSGQRMLKALVDGGKTPEQIAELAQGTLKNKTQAIAEAVRGERLSGIQKEVIRSAMRHLIFLEMEIEQLDKLSADQIRESGQQTPHERLQTIPGIGEQAAANLLAETGADMHQFPSAGHLSSWGGVCPGNNESAGKHKSRHTTHGNPWFRATLTECAWSASRTKGTVFEAEYQRLKPRIGHNGALVAVAHQLVEAIYWVLIRNEPYRSPLRQPLTEVQKQRLIRHHTRRLRRLGGWLPAEHLAPLKDWYVSHCVPLVETQPKRRGRKKSSPKGGDR
jgi:transposase